LLFLHDIDSTGEVQLRVDREFKMTEVFELTIDNGSVIESKIT